MAIASKNWFKRAIDEATKDDHALESIEKTSNPEERKECPPAGCGIKRKKLEQSRLDDSYVFHNTRSSFLPAIESKGLQAGSFADRPIDFGGDIWIAVKKSDLPYKLNNLESHSYGEHTAFEPYWEQGYDEQGNIITHTVPPEKLLLVNKHGKIIRRLGRPVNQPKTAAVQLETTKNPWGDVEIASPDGSTRATLRVGDASRWRDVWPDDILDSMSEGKIGVLSYLNVAEPMSRRGLGSQLLRDLMDKARGLGISKMYVHAVPMAGFDPSEFYSKLGFQEIGSNEYGPFMEIDISQGQTGMLLTQEPQWKMAPATFRFYQPTGTGFIPMFRLDADIPGHPRGSTVSDETLREAGFDIPPIPENTTDSTALTKNWFKKSQTEDYEDSIDPKDDKHLNELAHYIVLQLEKDDVCNKSQNSKFQEDFCSGKEDEPVYRGSYRSWISGENALHVITTARTFSKSFSTLIYPDGFGGKRGVLKQFPQDLEEMARKRIRDYADNDLVIDRTYRNWVENQWEADIKQFCAGHSSQLLDQDSETEKMLSNWYMSRMKAATTDDERTHINEMREKLLTMQASVIRELKHVIEETNKIMSSGARLSQLQGEAIKPLEKIQGENLEITEEQDEPQDTRYLDDLADRIAWDMEEKSLCTLSQHPDFKRTFCSNRLANVLYLGSYRSWISGSEALHVMSSFLDGKGMSTMIYPDDNSASDGLSDSVEGLDVLAIRTLDNYVTKELPVEDISFSHQIGFRADLMDYLHKARFLAFSVSRYERNLLYEEATDLFQKYLKWRGSSPTEKETDAIQRMWEKFSGLREQVVQELRRCVEIVRDILNRANSKIQAESSVHSDHCKQAQSQAGAITVYRGISVNNENRSGGGQTFFSADPEFARQFTQSGRDNEILVGEIDASDIYRSEPLPYGGNPDALDQTVAEARAKGFSAIYADEGAGGESILVFRKVKDGKPVLRWTRRLGSKISEASVINIPSRTVKVPRSDYNQLSLLAKKISSGNREWTGKELQLQQNYPEVLETLLNKLLETKTETQLSVSQNVLPSWFRTAQSGNFDLSKAAQAGNTIKLYHGGHDTGEDLTLKKGYQSGRYTGQDAGALFFTPSLQYAKQYQKSPVGLYETELDVSNCFDITNPSHIERLREGFLKEVLTGEYDTEDDALSDYHNAVSSMQTSASHGAADWGTASQWMEAMIDAGFDGAKFLERPGENIVELPDGGFDISGKPVYSYAIFKDSVKVRRAGNTSHKVIKTAGRPKWTPDDRHPASKLSRSEIDAKQRASGGYQFVTSCVQSTCELITSMVDGAENVSRVAFESNVNRENLLEFDRALKYDTGSERGGLRRKNDWAVRYARGIYDGLPCYYMVHSAIEYVYVADESLRVADSISAPRTASAKTAAGASTPELMSPDEFYQAANRGRLHKERGIPVPGEAEATTPLEVGELNHYTSDDIAHFYARRRSVGKGVTAEGVMYGQRELLADAASLRRPLNAEAVETWDLRLPGGYARKGDLYVYDLSATAIRKGRISTEASRSSQFVRNSKSTTANRLKKTQGAKRQVQGEYKSIGQKCLFEYHCYEGHDSSDAQLWYRSHQPITVLSIVERGYGKTQRERGENGAPAVYKVKFGDGFVGHAMEDELITSKSQFYRPDPPKPPSEI
jgi:GNAT superfamily N-acetyltransferase